MKRDRKILIITTILCLLPIVLGLAMYDSLPDMLSTHFDEKGNTNGFMPKNIAVWFLPVVTAGINAIVHIGLNKDPKRNNASVVIRAISLWVLPVLSCIFMPITLFKSIGYKIPVNTVTYAIIGFLLVVFGNYLPKCKHNYTVGIKLPWTLNNEDNWNKTHRLAGYLWMVGGLVMIFLPFLNIDILIVTIVILAILVGIPTVYSYGIYRKSKN